MDMPMKFLGQTIKAARKPKKMTQVELADALDMSESYIKDLERGRSTPSLSTLYELVHYLNFSVESFFYPVPDKDSAYFDLLRLLSQCDEDDYSVIISTTEALIARKKA